MGTSIVKVGDLFQITLSDNRKAIGHYVYWDDKNGPFIQVFNYFFDKEEVIIEKAIESSYMFPPVISGLRAAVRNGLWPVIGRKPVINFSYPNFISSHWNDKTGEVINWFLYNGTEFIRLGSVLPEDYKNFGYLVVWSPFDVIYRIETGNIPFPYGDMIKNNRFTPIIQRPK